MTSKSQNYLKDYQNIVEWNVNLLTVPFNPVIPIKRNRRPTPNEVKLRVLKNPRFITFVEQVTKNEKERKEKISEAITTLDEIGFNRKFYALRSLGAIIYKLMGQAYDSVNINIKSVENLKSQMGHRQVIYLPCHRSYADFMLMSIFCFLNNLEVPAIGESHKHMFLSTILFTLKFYLNSCWNGFSWDDWNR
jgi:hypothetical protein